MPPLRGEDCQWRTKFFQVSPCTFAPVKRLDRLLLFSGYCGLFTRLPQGFCVLAHDLAVLGKPDAVFLVTEFIGADRDPQEFRHPVGCSQFLDGAVRHEDHVRFEVSA